jgi:hypothetical protein
MKNKTEKNKLVMIGYACPDRVKEVINLISKPDEEIVFNVSHMESMVLQSENKHREVIDTYPDDYIMDNLGLVCSRCLQVESELVKMLDESPRAKLIKKLFV